MESASFVDTLVHPTKRSVSLGLYAQSEIVDAGNVTIPPNHDIPQSGNGRGSQVLVRLPPEREPSTSPCYLGEREDIEPSQWTVSQLKYRHEPAATIRVRAIRIHQNTSHQPTAETAGCAPQRVPLAFSLFQPTTTSVTHHP